MYKLKLSRREKKKLLQAKWLILLAAVIGVALVVWLAWVRPAQREYWINSFEQCVESGYPVQQTYPEVCLTTNGKRFVNQKQEADHTAGQLEAEQIKPPTDPSHLRLDIEEWGIRLPLTEQTFDLGYSYFEEAGNERLLFTYKRLLKAGICKEDAGLTVTRSRLQRTPPYDEDNPAPTAFLDPFYYYVEYDAMPCYDAKNPEHMEQVKLIAGDKSLAQATAALLDRIEPLPGAEPLR